MITRRNFIALFSGLTMSLFTSGHSKPQKSRLPVAKQPPTVATLNSSPVQPPSIKPSTPAAAIKLDTSVVDNIARARPIVEPKKLPSIQLNGQQMQLLRSILSRLTRVQNYFGYGNFNIIGFDQALNIARRQSSIGEFTAAELDFIEEVFFTNARSLGFYGDKVIENLSATIDKKDVLKIPATGHYLFKGIANDTYRKIRKDLGDSVVLTSGIRGVVKQIYLYLNKVRKLDGNLSLASFSLAPPGHSYHAIGDFDVGKKGFGRKNFTTEFAKTDEFKRLIDLGYLDIRYPPQNPFGVRYEPWHIKVV